MLPALKALHKHGIFSATEVKQIYKTRSDYERRLVARVAKKDDFLRYIEYETKLEQLRAVRWERISENASYMQTGAYEQKPRWTRWLNIVSREGYFIFTKEL